MDCARPMMAALAALTLLAAAAPAAAGDLDTPIGTGAASVEGEPLAVHHDAAGEGLGDDTISIREGVRELEVRWTGAPLGASASAGLRGFALRHGATPLVDDALDAVLASLPPEGRVADVDIREDGVEPFLLGESLFAKVFGDAYRTQPVWTTEWPLLGWGLAYDGVVFPTSIARSSDYLYSNMYHQAVWHTCWGLEIQLQAQLPGCEGPEAPFLDAIPNVALHAELQAADVELRPAGGATMGAALGGAAELDARDAGAAFGGSLAAHASAAGQLPDPAQELRADAARPSGDAAGSQAPSGALTLFVTDVPPSYMLPLALGALALLVPVWALYRRILPHRALAHPMRERILAAVRARPGVHESDLARELGLRHNHVQYHLRVLEDAGVLETRHFGGLKCIFELGRLSPAEKALAMAQRGRSQEVLAAVTGEPGISQRTIAQRLGMSESSVKWHLDRLEGSGVVRTERARGAKRAWPAAALLGPTLAPPPAALMPGAVPPAA